MHTKFDNIFARCLVIMEIVIISFIKEYRGRLWSNPVTSKMKNIFGIIWDFHIGISEVKLKLCLIFQNFQNGRNFELTTNFITGNYTGSLI